MAKTIAICNQKGGVAKTTTALNLGASLTESGYRTLLIDLDSQGDLTKALGIDFPDELEFTIADIMRSYISPKHLDIDILKQMIMKNDENIEFVPSNLDLGYLQDVELANAVSRETVLKRFIRDIGDDYDFILLDCLPSLGNLILNALTASDLLLIPSSAEYFSYKGLNAMLDTAMRVIENTNDKLKFAGILITQYDRRRKLHKEALEIMREQFGNLIPIFDTVIPTNSAVSNAVAFGQSVFAYDRNAPASKAYKLAMDELITKIDNLYDAPIPKAIELLEGKSLQTAFSNLSEIRKSEIIKEENE